jgi:four helix bundle protein
MSQGFRDLEVWKKSMELTETVYRPSSGFPSHEQFGLTSQVRRAAVSVASCIAEGHARFSRRDFARFVSMAMGSLAEVETQILLAQRLGYVGQDAEQPLAAASEIGKMLNGLRRSLNRELQPDT